MEPESARSTGCRPRARSRQSAECAVDAGPVAGRDDWGRSALGDGLCDREAEPGGSADDEDAGSVECHGLNLSWWMRVNPRSPRMPRPRPLRGRVDAQMTRGWRGARRSRPAEAPLFRRRRGGAELHPRGPGAAHRTAGAPRQIKVLERSSASSCSSGPPAARRSRRPSGWGFADDARAILRSATAVQRRARQAARGGSQ